MDIWAGSTPWLLRMMLLWTCMYMYSFGASLVAQWQRICLQCKCCRRCGIRSLAQEDALEEVMASHFSILAWRIPWTEETGGLRSVGPQRVRHDWSNLACSMHILVPDFNSLGHILKSRNMGSYGNFMFNFLDTAKLYISFLNCNFAW